MVLEFLDVGTEFVEHGVEVVDDGIEQGVGEVVGLGFPDGAPAAAEAGPDRVEDVVLALFLHRDDEIFPEKQTDLFATNGAVFVLIDHLGDDENVIGGGLDFRPLAGVEDVLERERMEIEFFPEEGERLDIAEPVDVDPGHFAVFDMRGEFGDVGDFPFLEVGTVILDDLDRRLAAFAIDQMRHQRGRRGARRAVAFHEHGRKCREGRG